MLRRPGRVYYFSLQICFPGRSPQTIVNFFSLMVYGRLSDFVEESTFHLLVGEKFQFGFECPLLFSALFRILFQ